MRRCGMAKIGACVEIFFADLDYRRRIEKVAALGFKSYEFWFHDKRFDGKRLIDEPKDFEMIGELNERHGLVTTDFVFNHPDGGVVASLIDKKDGNRILDSIEEMIGLAKKIGCKRLISGSGNKIAGLKKEKAVENMIGTLSRVAGVCEKNDVTIILEPFNTKVDHPDYFLDDPETALQVLKQVNHRNVRMLFDIYHMQIMAGNVTAFIRENIGYIGHFHIAGVPGRHEPASGELNYRFIAGEIDKTGYDGCIGLEYWPTIGHEESLRQTLEYFKG
jgi:hydroxypyruvate isomerase